MKMASMGNRVRIGVLLTLSLVIPLLLVMTDATPALSEAPATVRFSNLGESTDRRISIFFDQYYAYSFCTGSIAATLDKVRMHAMSFERNYDPVSAPVVTIRSNDISGEPGPVLHTLTSPFIDNSAATAEDFSCSGYELAGGPPPTGGGPPASP